jgi:hypothetical protein
VTDYQNLYQTTMEIDKIIAQNAAKLSKWEEQYQEFVFENFNSGSVSKEESERIFFQTNELLIAIANNFFAFGKFKDEWDTSKCSFYYMGQHLLLKSKKMDIEFDWGLQEDRFFLQCYICNGENLRYMTDSFWETLLELKTFGDFEFIPQFSLNAQERVYFENKTSTVFQLIRNFMIEQSAAMNKGSNPYEGYLNTGDLRLTWPPDLAWAELLSNACQAFKLLYSINYQLWKINDLKRKKK